MEINRVYFILPNSTLIRTLIKLYDLVRIGEIGEIDEIGEIVNLCVTFLQELNVRLE
jgi:hypothetical protein